MICRSVKHFSQKHAHHFVPLPYQPENNDISVQTPPTGFDALRTIAVSRIYLDNFDHITAYWVGLAGSRQVVSARSRGSRRQGRTGAESFSPRDFPEPSRVDRSLGLGYSLAMNFGVLFEKVTDKEFPAGYYYAHVPSLGLTTHGLGVEGAREAAADLLRLWIAEKLANGEKIVASTETLFSTLELPDDALQSA